MCLILFAVSPNAQWNLVVAANRDEQHQRPTLKADFWQDNQDILGGRDLQAGGTWLGLTRTGRFAAVTNFAETPAEPLPPRSRGELTRQFLMGNMSCVDYMENIDPEADQYRGFNLLLSDGKQVCYYSNQQRDMRILSPGYYGLSNQLLDCNWPKVNAGRDGLKALVDNDFSSAELYNLLAYRGSGEAHSARFIVGENYGTNVGTVVKLGESQMTFEERRFDAAGVQNAQIEFNLSG